MPEERKVENVFAYKVFRYTVSGQLRLCFSRSKRLTEKHQFDLVFRKPEYRTSRGSVRAKACANHLDHPRLGIVVAKRQFPRAVVRNAIKREIREGFRLACSELPGVDIVVQVFSFKMKDQFSRSLEGIWQDIVLDKNLHRDIKR